MTITIKSTDKNRAIINEQHEKISISELELKRFNDGLDFEYRFGNSLTGNIGYWNLVWTLDFLGVDYE